MVCSCLIKIPNPHIGRYCATTVSPRLTALRDYSKIDLGWGRVGVGALNRGGAYFKTDRKDNEKNFILNDFICSKILYMKQDP